MVSEVRDLYALEVDSVDSKHKTLNHIRPVPLAEDEEIRSATRLLRRMTEDSALKRLRALGYDFLQSVSRLEALTDVAQMQHLTRPVQRDFKSWLSAFRAIDDQTSVWLSDQFGKDSEAFKSFKVRLSAEYDANFAYRLCSTLRNASEHADDVLIGSSLQRTADENGEVRNVLKLQLDSAGLLEAFPKLKASVRTELSPLSAPLDVARIMGEVGISCERVYCGLLIDLRAELERAIDLCAKLTREAKANGGSYAVLLNADAFDNPEKPNLSWEYSPQNLADVVARNLTAAQRVLARPVEQVAPADLAVPPSTA